MSWLSCSHLVGVNSAATYLDLGLATVLNLLSYSWSSFRFFSNTMLLSLAAGGLSLLPEELALNIFLAVNPVLLY